MDPLLQQLKTRRLAFGLKQNDMVLRIGVSRQQYQRLESKGNPRLSTLELIAKGLKCEIMLIPEEKLSAVLAVLEDCVVEEGKTGSKGPASENITSGQQNLPTSVSKKSLSHDPWQDLWS